MSTIPISLKIDPARRCLVVGGGTVALRKTQWLLDCGTRVEAISPEFDPALEELARERPEDVTLRREAYQASKLGPYLLVIAATDDAKVNRQVAWDARRADVPVNVVDHPKLCTFYVPAVVGRGELKIAISTGGHCPTLAARLRRELEEWAPEWYETLAAALGEVRLELKGKIREEGRRHDLMVYLATSEVTERLIGMDLEGIRAELRRLAAEWLENG